MLDKKIAHAEVNRINATREMNVRASIQQDTIVLENLFVVPGESTRRSTHVAIRNGMVSAYAVERALAQLLEGAPE